MNYIDDYSRAEPLPFAEPLIRTPSSIDTVSLLC